MRRPLLPTLAAALGLLAAPALAHHGWSWTEDGFFELEGTITAISFGNPHPVLSVDGGDGVWQVELAPPAATTRAGFTADTAETGDEITAIGNRSRDADERRMKAVRLVHEGKTYDVYPSRVPTN